MYLGQDPQNLDVVRKGTKVLRLRRLLLRLVSVVVSRLEPFRIDLFVLYPEVIATRQRPVNLLVGQCKLERRCNRRVSVKQIDHPEEPPPRFILDKVFWFW